VILDLLLPLSAVALAGIVAIAVVARYPRAGQSWLLLAGMATMGTAVILDALSNVATEPEVVAHYQVAAKAIHALVPGFWLAFSLVFARGNSRDFLRRSRWGIAAAFLVPLGLVAGSWPSLIHEVSLTETQGWLVRFGPGGTLLAVTLLLVAVAVLMNIEATFWASVGTTRWRIKFVTLGIAVIFGARIYARGQGVLFSGQPLAVTLVESAALLIGAVRLGVGYLRQAFAPLDVYPMKAGLGQSVAVLLVGGYFFVVGVLAQVITFIGDAANFQFQAFAVLLGIVLVAILTLSDRLRQKIKFWFSRYFRRPFYDFRKVWTQFSEQLVDQVSPSAVCRTTARLLVENFRVLSVRVWLLEERTHRLQLGASTAPSPDEALASEANKDGALGLALTPHQEPFNLETANGPLATLLRRCNPTQFQNGGERLAVPLSGNDKPIGVIVLADRVSGALYTPEEFDLLNCIGRQVSAALLNQRITHELMQAKELEAFQTMSAFFVHDLKNAVSTLNLMLQNLPVHFDNPEFRQDALRGIGRTAERVNHLIARLGELRRKLELRPVETDLNVLIDKTVRELNGLPEVQLSQELRPIPKLRADPELLGSVVSNLLLNARDAVNGGGNVRVETTPRDGSVVLTVSDEGGGMTPEFVATSLFRPFSSTKNKGLGIGMFQCKMIVEAHRGTISVESELGKGTVFRVTLPCANATAASAQ
jgi:putative PEP-CTERM system histidine kinase